MAPNNLFEGLKQLVALIFVNLVPLLLDPGFLSVAISIDALVLGIAVQEFRIKRNEDMLKQLLLELVELSKNTRTAQKTAEVISSPGQQEEEKVG